MMNFMGIDLSLVNTGVVVLGEDGESLKNKSIKTESMRGMKRIQYIRDTLKDFMQEYSKSLCYIALEDYSYGSRGCSLFNIAELGGIIRMFLYESTYRSKSILVSPKTLKKFVTGNGNSGKEIMLKDVYMRWKFDTNDNNIADAYGLAKVAYLYKLMCDNRHKDLPLFQIDCFSKIKKGVI